MSISFATFAAYNAPALGDDVIEQLVLHTASIRKSHGPQAILVLLTDEILADPRALQLFDVVRRRPVTVATLLLDRARHYHAFVEGHDWASHIAFLDFDILVMKDLHPVFSGYADVYLTVRNWSKNMPFNGGVVFLQKDKPDLCRAFYNDVLGFYERLEPEHRQWYGDQFSLMAAVTTGGNQLSADLIQTRSGALVGIVPRNDYNHTPYDVDTGRDIPQVPEPVDVAFYMERPVLHFKGPRKHLMSIIAKAAGL